MMKFFWIAGSILVLTACQDNSQQATINHQQKEIDSLKTVVAQQHDKPSSQNEPLNPLPEEKEEKPETASDNGLIRTGRHSLTLQWISWDQPGTVDIKKIGDNKYTVKGRQDGQGKDYLKIDGILEPINERELKFSGLVEHAISHIGEGKVCKKEGNYIFKATGSRKYWRMQDMNNCYDGVTDYVDIYF